MEIHQLLIKCPMQHMENKILWSLKESNNNVENHIHCFLQKSDNILKTIHLLSVQW